MGEKLTAAARRGRDWVPRLGGRLAAARAAAGLTQAAAGAKAGVSPVNIAMYELGLRTPSVRVLLSLARCYRVSLDALALGRRKGVA